MSGPDGSVPYAEWLTEAELAHLTDEQRVQRGIGFVQARAAGLMAIINRLEEAPVHRRAQYIRTLTEACDIARDGLHAARVACVRQLHHDEGLSYGQIGELLGLSRSRVAQLDGSAS